MKTHHPYRPYLKAYVFYGLFTAILFFLFSIPFYLLALLICKCLGCDIDSLKPFVPYYRSVVCLVVGFFVFRKVIRMEILPRCKLDEVVEQAKDTEPEA